MLLISNYIINIQKKNPKKIYLFWVTTGGTSKYNYINQTF